MFQGFNSNVLHEIVRKHQVYVYKDDIILMTCTVEQHIILVSKFLVSDWKPPWNQLQSQSDGKLHHVFLYFRRATAAESRWDPFTKHLLVVIDACNKFVKLYPHCSSPALVPNYRTRHTPGVWDWLRSYHPQCKFVSTFIWACRRRWSFGEVPYLYPFSPKDHLSVPFVAKRGIKWDLSFVAERGMKWWKGECYEPSQEKKLRLR